jgi:5'-3' exonuclease
MANLFKRTKPLMALIDGDTLAFRAAAAVNHTMHWPTGLVENFARKPEGEGVLINMMDKLQKRLGFQEMKVFLSCPTNDNWRLEVDPNYKANRKDSIRPLLLGHLKGFLRLNFAAQHMAYLEADDAIGVWATSEILCPSSEYDKIIVGRDKDFMTIPGLHYQLGDDVMGLPDPKVITPGEAVKNHYVQALAGDAVDGYPGCPGIGMKTARRIIEAPTRLVPKEGIITRGARKGMIDLKWHEDGPCGIWEAIICRYKKAGLSEREALKTARLAKILLAEDYELETATVRLWTPSTLD